MTRRWDYLLPNMGEADNDIALRDFVTKRFERLQEEAQVNTNLSSDQVSWETIYSVEESN